MAWTYSFDTSTPDGATQSVSVVDDHLRLIKQAVQERLAADHCFPLTGTQVSNTDAGKHKQVRFFEGLSAKPTLETGECAFYSKEVDGVPELFFEAEDGTEKQLTDAGTLNVAYAEIAGLLPNDTYMTAVDEAGTGTVDLIKAGKNEADDTEVAVLPDEARLATNAAPTEDTQLANKKYVDDQIPALVHSGTAVGTTNITASGSWTDMTDMSVTLTTVGGNILAIFTATFETWDARTSIYLRFDLDGSPYGTQRDIPQETVGADGYEVIKTIHYMFTEVAAGSHTIKVQWNSTYAPQQDGATYPRILTAMEVPA